MLRCGQKIKVTPCFGEPLSFKLTLNNIVAHSKINGGGFSSNKEKVINSVPLKLFKLLGRYGKIIRPSKVIEEEREKGKKMKSGIDTEQGSQNVPIGGVYKLQGTCFLFDKFS